jgi:transcriptional regulator with XRE-family HTH domain
MKEKRKKVKTGSKISDPDFVALGKRMKELRLKKGFGSYEVFAYEHGLSRVLYGAYEKGEGNITYKNLLKIIRALDVSVKEFFNEGFE